MYRQPRPLLQVLQWLGWGGAGRDSCSAWQSSPRLSLSHLNNSPHFTFDQNIQVGKPRQGPVLTGLVPCGWDVRGIVLLLGQDGDGEGGGGEGRAGQAAVLAGVGRGGPRHQQRHPHHVLLHPLVRQQGHACSPTHLTHPGLTSNEFNEKHIKEDKTNPK